MLGSDAAKGGVGSVFVRDIDYLRFLVQDCDNASAGSKRALQGGSQIRKCYKGTKGAERRH